MHTSEEEPIPPFEQWLANNKKYLPQRLHKGLEKPNNCLSFIFFWKRYEQLQTPKFYALLKKQYPAVAAADQGFAARIWKTIEHRIFGTAEFAWKIVLNNAEGKHPAEVYKKIYTMALENRNSPGRHMHFYDETTIPEEYKGQDEEKVLKMLRSWNEEDRRRLDKLNNFNKEVIDVLQEDLLTLLPELMDMTAPWWTMYRFLLLDQCGMWKWHHDRLNSLISLQMGAEWLQVDRKECRAEIDRRIDERFEEQLRISMENDEE